MHHPLRHFEIVSRDAQRAQSFYTRLFDWDVDTDNAIGYRLVRSGTFPITGGIAASSSEPTTVLYFGSDDVRRDARRAQVAGAQMVIPVTKVHSAEFALFACPYGHLLGLWSLADLPPFPSNGRLRGQLVGFEVATPGVDDLTQCLERILDWDIGSSGVLRVDEPGSTGRVLREASPRTSIVVAVDSLDQLHRDVRSLGCQVTGPLEQWVDGRKMLRFADPDGNVVGVVER